MAGPFSREQALSLLAAANNHGDLAVKLSSLRQAKDILLSIDPSLAAELLPYLLELQSSPETLVRKTLVEVMEEIGLKAMDRSSILMPILLSSLKDTDVIVTRQSIVSGTNIFCNVLEELSLQFHRRGIVERWLEELWTWMVRFKDAVFGILLEAGSVGTKLLALKFLETYVLLFTSDTSDSKKSITEVITRSGRAFNISWLVGGHPVLEPVVLASEANRCLGVLLDLLRSASSLPGSLTISVVNCLAAIARKRQLHYSSILSALLDFDPNFEMLKGGHTASIQYSLRSALLGFLRCTSPTILESRDCLLRALRAMNAGDAADQVIRQVDKKIRNNERAMRDLRLSKEDQQSSQLPASGDPMRKRSMPQESDETTYSHESASKRTRYGPTMTSAPPVQITDSGQHYSVNGVSPKVPLLDSDLTPVEKMVAMIGALIAEGDRAVESLKMLISQIHPDLLADIVITNMKHLANDPPPLTRLSSFPVTQEGGGSSSSLAQVKEQFGSTISAQAPLPTVQVPSSSSNAIGSSLSDTSASTNLPLDPKRDPRRDPRRLDPRRVVVPIGVQSTPMVDDTNANHSGPIQFEVDASVSVNKPPLVPVVTSGDNISLPLKPKMEIDLKTTKSTVVSSTDRPAPKVEVLDEEAEETIIVPEVNASSDLLLSPIHELDEDLSSMVPKSSDVLVTDEIHIVSHIEADQLSPAVSNTTDSEEDCPDLPVLPSYVELAEEEQKKVRNLAVEQIIESYKHLEETDISQTRMALLARLVAQVDVNDDMVVMMHKQIVSDYQHQKGHELVMHVLYHLHALMISDSAGHSYAAAVYEKFLLGVAKSLLDDLPSSDKSFGRFLGEVPFLPDSLFRLLEDICYSGNQGGKDVCDGDRVTQGLSAVWGLIVGRPPNRQACLDIALKCAIHSQDDIRVKAIRLVANKLYVLNYISESIEQFATNMLLSAVDHRVSDVELLQSGSTEERKEGERGSQETSISGSQISEPGTSENDSLKGSQSDSQSDSSVSFSKAQSLISLFFALCTKKPILLQLVFDNYARSPKAVKQAVHRHIPILMRALGSSYSELLRIISNPPEGSENLLTQVLHILLEGTTPPPDLIATVKHLYETKLKDATILIPVLSSLSKKEVLPIFPRLVDLPLDKFQRALAHILQGSAHTGPALTPAEVLVAIHDINPEKDGLPLKKITDACSACFEQRTVFTQQVLAKALNQMVDQTPLPLLFMRTVIQAIDAFPTLVDFVMELLSKLVVKQVWRMPKLWFGFLKCVSQTQPHSFVVLLKLPSPVLESALNKYSNLRGPLVAFARQPIIKAALPRSTLVLLGLANESHMQQPRHAASLHASDTGSSVHGASLT